MKPPPQQLVFDLPHRSALGLEDFLVSGSNEAAIELVDEAVMYREALMMGLDQGDEIIRRRLRQKVEFLTADTAPTGEKR